MRPDRSRTARGRKVKQPADPAEAATDTRALAKALSSRLAGIPLERGADAPDPRRAVVWVDEGDEAVVHLSTLEVRLVRRAIVVSIEFETDQSGRSPLVVAIAVGGADETHDLIAATEEVPRGDAALASRWGHLLQDAVWEALKDAAAEGAGAPEDPLIGLGADDGVLRTRCAAPVDAATLRKVRA